MKPPAMDVTEDRTLGGRVLIRQPREGYRAGLDAALLAAACDAGAGQRVIEVGCGVGAALLAAAKRRSEALFVGVERDPAALALALENIPLNGLGSRVSVVAGDVGGGFRALGLTPFDAALANPPFFDNPGALRGPVPAKRGAWIAEDGLAAWIAFLIKAVREGGAITLIHRADRLVDILGMLSEGAGSIQILPVAPFVGAPARRVLVRAVRSGRAPLKLLPPLILHERSGPKHTAEAESILRGAAALTWT